MIELFLAVAMNLYNVPYIYGGNSPLYGLDCSGFVMECLRSVGVGPSKDSSAQMIYDFFVTHGNQVHTPLYPKRGDLLYFGKNNLRINHIAIALDSKYMIEAGGGDRSCKTPEDAVKMDARVRIRPISNRVDFLSSSTIF